MQHNTLGTNGFLFVEFSAPEQQWLEQIFLQMGFVKVASHKQQAMTLFRQGQISFIVNFEPNSHAANFAKSHGPGASAMGLIVADGQKAKEYALNCGAKQAPENQSYELSAIEGVGGSLIYLISEKETEAFFESQFEFLEGINIYPYGLGLTYIDHLTHNVKQGKMDEWASFYERIFNFKEIRKFTIQGKQTGLLSRAMTSPCGKIRIPINESCDDKSQIEEFIEEFNGEGIQHIALGTEDIYQSIATMKCLGIEFLTTPETYYDLINERLPWHKENLEKLKELMILIDGDKGEQHGLLLQIFTANLLGPVFFEIIQRKGNQGFGEGNFQALFEAMELDQIQRGKI